MSDGRLGILIGALFAFGASVLAGQSTPTLAGEIARWSVTVDSLRRLQATTSLLGEATSAPPRAAAEATDLELIAVGGYRIRTNRSPLPVAAAAHQAWGRVVGYYGTAGESFVPRRFVVQGIDPDTTEGELDQIASLTVPWDTDSGTLALSLVTLGGVPPVDSGVVLWLGAAPVPAVSLESGLVAAYDALTLSPFSAGHACIGGATAGCLEALDLGGGAVSVEGRFPGREDRRRAVMLIGRHATDATQSALIDRCTIGGDDAICTRLLRETEPGALPLLSDRVSRGPLLEVALRTGGAEGFRRLVESAGRPMGERLGTAAGVPLDTLIDRWRGEMLQARHAARPWSSRLGVAALGWCVLLLFSALWSSRWRAD